MSTFNWLGEIDGKVERVAQTDNCGPGAADLVKTIAFRKFPTATIGRVWPEGNDHWWGVVYPGEVMPVLFPTGVEGYTVEYRVEAFETVGRVYCGREHVGTFYIHRSDNAAFVGRSRVAVVSPAVAMLKIIRAHRKVVGNIERTHALMGCPA